MTRPIVTDGIAVRTKELIVENIKISSGELMDRLIAEGLAPKLPVVRKTLTEVRSTLRTLVRLGYVRVDGQGRPLRY